MPTLIKIEFKRSSSKHFAEALRAAKRLPGFAKEEKNGPYSIEIVDMEQLLANWDNFNLLYHYAAHWSGTTICYKDNIVTFLGKRNDFLYSIMDLKDCFREYKQTEYKHNYCTSEGWCCARLHAINRHIKKYSWSFQNWYFYGHFKNPTTWAIDKPLIKRVLSDDAKMRYLDACPLFNIDDLDPIIATLPDVIKLDPENWEINYEREYTEKGFVLVPKSISHIEKLAPEMIDMEAFGNEPPTIEIPENLTNDEANRIIDLYFK